MAGIAELYALLATSGPVLEQTIQALDLDVSATDLSARVRAETVIGSPFFAVSASDPDPTLAASIANEVGAVLAATNHGASASPHALQIVESAIPPVGSADGPRLISAGVAGVLMLLIFTVLIVLPRDAAATHGRA